MAAAGGAGSDAPAGMAAAAAAAAGGGASSSSESGPWRLSTEGLPAAEGPVNAVAVLDDDVLVSGGDDHVVTVWRRAGHTADFGPVASAAEAEGCVKAIRAIPPGAGGGADFPTGGFAVGGLDKAIRLYSYDPATNGVALVRTLTGHTGGVLALAWDRDGCLLSGSWDGTARVWDIGTGACLHTLAGHENGTCVVGLPNGDIVVGSTGRKNDANQHVDYQLRRWRTNAMPGAPPAYVVVGTLTDHEQAVRDVALLPAGAGFVSCGNDGQVVARGLDGARKYAFLNPMSGEGKPFSAFRLAVAPDGTIASANEDQTVRVYAPDGGSEELTLPGTAWGVAFLPNGDLAVGCGQAATSRVGHMYVFSRSPARPASDLTTINYAAAMEPPKKKGGRSGAGAGGSGAGPDVTLSGPYETRAAVTGTQDGQFGFFSLPDGGVMVCTWSAVTGAWVDMGPMVAGPDGSGGMEVDDSATAGGAGAFDYSCAVTAETSSGVRSMTLRFNEADDPVDVATAFCAANGVPPDNVDTVSSFVMERKMERAAQRQRASAIRQFTHFPATAYMELYTVDFKKVLPKLLELNGARPAGEALNEGEVAAVTRLVGVLEAVTRYHATVVDRAAVRLLLSRLWAWPVAALLPVADITRILVLHSDGAAAVAEVGGARFLATVTAMLRSAKGDAAARGVVLTATRVLFNCFRHGDTRDLMGAAAGDVLDTLPDLLAYDHATVKYAATALMYNYAVMFIAQRKAKLEAEAGAVAPLPGAPRLADPDPDRVQQLVAVVAEGLDAVADEDATYNLLVIAGTLASIAPAHATFACDLGLDAKLAATPARFPASDRIKECVIELRGVLAAAPKH